jgi:serine/threonine-protein kinase
MRCSSCQAENPAASRFCNACGASLTEAASTGTATPRKPPSTSTADEGRFPAGTVLGERYRVLGLLGRGGMGEVYRAVDLKLEQQVALKFLPPAATARNSQLLERFRSEVRIARQVSHRNVCRVYDLGEVDGAPYISMEYVDGETLGSLLHRIGRLPGDKALEFARRLCAGLAAAHEKGVLHRDLKPANIMIDGQGQVRIMDFGLAAAADAIAGGDIRSGTPAYMAPEQRDGREVTVRSDIYSLGLVIAEMFTGQKAAADGKITTTTKDLDPAVEKVIRRCLDPNPRDRQATALEVARALPGGDLLAEALAAGDTPSPEMVAASEEQGTLSVRAAVVCLSTVIAGSLVLVFWLSQYNVFNVGSFPYSPEILAQKAREIAVRLGDTEPPGESDYGLSVGVVDRNLRAKLTSGQPAVIVFWYRQGPRPQAAPPFARGLDEFQDETWIAPGPPPLVPGSVQIRLDPRGRLIDFRGVPQSRSTLTPSARTADWTVLFDTSGIDSSQLSPVQVESVPPVSSDQQAAWTGRFPDEPSEPMHVAAAALNGVPVYFSLRSPAPPQGGFLGPDFSQTTRVIVGMLGAVVILSTAIAVTLAWSNYRRGRGDLKGSSRLAIFGFAGSLALVSDGPYDVARELGSACVSAAVMWVLYMALEPYVRRRWPETLISWTRLLSGRLRDPLVSGHMLAGLALGVALAVLFHTWLVIQSRGEYVAVGVLHLGAGRWLLDSIGMLAYVVQVSFGSLFLLFLLRAFLPRPWLFFVAAVLVVPFLPASVFEALTTDIVDRNVGAALTFVVGCFPVLALLRLGLLSVVVMLFAGVMAANFVSPDYTAWYAAPGIAGMATILLAALVGFRFALGGRKVWQRNPLEG